MYQCVGWYPYGDSINADRVHFDRLNRTDGIHRLYKYNKDGIHRGHINNKDGIYPLILGVAKKTV
ncbi:hypothetical protein D9M68_606900 [compost metagenome]